MENARKRLQVDIGFGDVVIPRTVKTEFPVLLEGAFQVSGYSVESVISEKFEAMVRLSIANSRMKDFYDVYYISKNRALSSGILKKAIKATFGNRQTAIPENHPIFKEEFSADKKREEMWRAFLRKSHINAGDITFREVMQEIVLFLEPLINSIKTKSTIGVKWNTKKSSWE
ncbi:nucleotidyl transferase AbiEii/AbiGii toxin family protein [bacterium]|nr:nucleotidyl transferase AbiEii/AbiGii toxin family protein [bacterium]